jgi:TonB-dependent SusC/RagA subfamily outer membrane receptor
MIKKNQPYKILLLAIILLNSIYAESQRLLTSRKTSFYTYIYRLNDDEAKQIYRKDTWIVDSSFFHTLVDSFPTDSQYNIRLPAGHYLETYSKQNNQHINITTVQDFNVVVLNNNTDLCLQIYDLKGNIIPDALVEVRGRKIHFDNKTQSYIDKKSNQKGLLEVTYKGFKTYYELTRNVNNSKIKRTYRKVVYGTPLKYVWRPVRYIIFLPIDGVRSIVKGLPIGVIERTWYFFSRTFDKIGCIFNKYNCDYYNNRFERNHTGYIAFNKPKYKPGDTVKFKAFLVTKKGKTINKTVSVVLENHGKNIKLTSLTPYTKGGYEYEFFLHDSLNLKLDDNYFVYLELKDNKQFIHGSFMYEDYELKKNKLSIRVDSAIQYRNKANNLYIKGTDENDLNLLDARIEVFISPVNISQFFEKQIFIPDTLLFLNKKLDPTDETEIIISDSLFPKINFDYNIQIKLFTSDNEVLTENKEIHYFFDLKEFNIQLKADSLNFVFYNNGISEKKNARILAADNFGNETQIYKGSIPYKIKLNPFYSLYTITSDSILNTIKIDSKPSLLNCFSERTKDSLKIIFDNPHKIPFSYNIYIRNNQILKGYGDSLDVEKKIRSKKNYFVSLRYLWGGQVKEESYRIPFLDNNLNISVKQPNLVYPGQKTKIEILVKDANEKPVSGVDLTAYSMTKKFGYTPPELPVFREKRKDKSLINNFSFKSFDLEYGSWRNLDYKKWRTLAGIDSIEYYKFLYPGKSLYRFEYIAPDSLTQFAPFVVSKGVTQPIHVIYIDSRPVYFSWSTNTQPYSFLIHSGYHQIKLRTVSNDITIDSMYFAEGRKLIFSVNQDSANKKVKIQKAESQLSEFEQSLLYKYIFPYQNTFGDNYAYIEDDDNGEIQFLQSANNKQYINNLAGPVSGYQTFHLMDSYSLHFFHEPYFQYEFGPELLKMRSVDYKKDFPKYLSNYQYEKTENMADFALTKKELIKQWNKYLESKNQKKPEYNFPHITMQGEGRLLLNINNTQIPGIGMPLNIIVLKDGDKNFARVYPGNTSLIQGLSKGFYKIVFFYRGSKYFIENSVRIIPNGINYYEVLQPQSLKSDSLGLQFSKIIEQDIFNYSASTYYPESFFHQQNSEPTYNVNSQAYSYTGEGKTIEGYVYDKNTNEPVPFVTVFVKDTKIGTYADVNGKFLLRVPYSAKILVFTFIGMKTQEVEIGSRNYINVSMETSSNSLQEVMVTVNGISRGARSLAYSTAVYGDVSTVGPENITSALAGKIAGVQVLSINSLPENAVSIDIKGKGTTEFKHTPLYVINGSIFTGDISELDPALIENIQILNDSNATAIYGRKGANGVVIITTKAGTFKPKSIKGAEYDDQFYEVAFKSSAIREKFSDYAFWQPRLITDKEGKVSFDVTFPDDITSWETFYLAMNNKKQTGQTNKIIKSYKPLMAQLFIPRFLIQDDTSYAIGKVLNYAPTSFKTTTQYELNDNIKFTKNQKSDNSIVDSLPVFSPKDSVKLKYFVKTESGYYDGELRTIPVFPIGLEETKGKFIVMDKDTTMQVPIDSTLGNVSIYAKADVLDVIDDEISNLISYLYNCNEQISSKLKALFAERTIADYKGRKFNYDKQVEKLIQLLINNEKTDGMWGWFKDSEENEWISLHIIETLIYAEKLGYKVNWDKSKITETLIWKIDNSKNFSSEIWDLKILRLIGSQIDYQRYINNLDLPKNLSLNDQLRIIELKQLCKLNFKPDTLKYYQKSTLFGSIYYSDESTDVNITSNDIQNTLLAYKILKNDSLTTPRVLTKMRNFFFEKRGNGYWRNTYESAKIIETILPDLLGKKSKPEKPILYIKGDINKTITDFPFEMQIKPYQKIQISKTGDFPVYFTSYQRLWNKKPVAKKGDFEITTRFENDSASYLKAGKETKLVVNVTVKKNVEYVMINIPIPGGCSYADKRNNLRFESHREYFKNETTIFCENLPKGDYVFDIMLLPKYTGIYTLNPAKVELMYFPTFNANDDIKKVRIK